MSSISQAAQKEITYTWKHVSSVANFLVEINQVIAYAAASNKEAALIDEAV